MKNPTVAFYVLQFIAENSDSSRAQMISLEFYDTTLDLCMRGAYQVVDGAPPKYISSISKPYPNAILYCQYGDNSIQKYIRDYKSIIFVDSPTNPTMRLQIKESWALMADVVKVGKMPKCHTIDRYFMSSNSYVQEIDLSGLSGLRKIDDNFMSKCQHLDKIIMPAAYVSEIGKMFLYGCQSLRKFEFSKLAELKCIEAGFMADCRSMIEADFSRAKYVVNIGRHFMNDCVSLRYIRLDGLKSLQYIDEYFMYRCDSITDVDLRHLRSLRYIESYFMNRCRSLRHVSLTGLHIEIIGHKFLADNLALETLDLGNLRYLREIGKDFLYGCSNLKYLDLSRLDSLRRIQDGFLRGCARLEWIQVNDFLYDELQKPEYKIDKKRIRRTPK